MENARLTMRQRSKLELVLYIGQSRLFLGLCENVEVVIDSLKIRYTIFVIETGDHDLVLG